MKSLYLLLILGACSGYKVKEVKNSKIEKDFVVKDASNKYRPTWIESPSQWVKENKQTEQGYQFHSYEIDAQPNKEIACDLARAKAKLDFAAQISSQIDQKLNNKLNASSATQSQLTQLVSAQLVGAQTVATYWEKRVSLKEKTTTFSCAQLIKISQDAINRSIDTIKNN